MDELQLLRRLDYDWVVRSNSVWNDPPIDVDAINEDARDELRMSLAGLEDSDKPECPLGLVFVGRGGVGKTHLLQWLRGRTFERNMTFLFADLTGVRDFWETMQLQIIASIDCELPDGYRQCQHVLAGLLNSVVKKPQKRPIGLADKLAKWSVTETVDYTQRLIALLSRTYRVQMMQHQDVLRALIMLNSDKIELNNAANAWLHGTETDEELLQRFAFTSSGKPPIDIVRGVSWFLSLRGPTVLAIDQMDNLIAQQRFRFENAEDQVDEIVADDDQARRLKAITQDVAGGLGDPVQTVMQRTLVVVSCYEETWVHTAQVALRAAVARFQDRIVLSNIPTGQSARLLAEGRLTAAAKRLNITPPSSSWLFAPEAFENTAGMSPRELLQKCERHRRHCLKLGHVEPLTTFDADGRVAPAPPPPVKESGLDQEFARLKQSAKVASCFNKSTEDQVWPGLMESALAGLRHECTFPPHMDVVIDGRLAGGKSYRYLHARLKIIDHQRQGQEQQFGFRVLTHDNASAFQNRLKAAMGDAGIDKRLAFRSLTVVRNDLPPKGAKTEKLVGQFGRMGGRWATISKEEIRTLHAVQELLKSHGAEAHDWIRERRPISEIGFIRVSGLLEAIAALGDGPSQPPEPATPAPPVSPSPTPTRETPPPAPSPTSRPPSSKASGALHLGVREQAGGKLGAPILVPWVDLTRHTLVVAGSGSGKTNLLKRIVEEATIKGIPSIVVDCNNDLIGLGEKRPPKAVPTEWTDDDRAKERCYTGAREVITWTPNRKGGNPVALPLLPNFGSLADDPDELSTAVTVTCNNLEKVVAPGASAKSQKKKGVLSQVVKHFAAQGGDTIEKLIEMLRELPSDVHTGISDEVKLAAEMADRTDRLNDRIFSMQRSISV